MPTSLENALGCINERDERVEPRGAFRSIERSFWPIGQDVEGAVAQQAGRNARTRDSDMGAAADGAMSEKTTARPSPATSGDLDHAFAAIVAGKQADERARRIFQSVENIFLDFEPA
jgi:hypothetical protein